MQHGRQHYHSDYHAQQRCGAECEFCLCRAPAPGIWAEGEACSQIAFNMLLSGCLCLAKDPLSLWVHCAQSRYANVEHSEKWNYYYLCKLHLKSWLGGWCAYVLVCLRTAWREFRLCHVAQSVSFISNNNWANGNAFCETHQAGSSPVLPPWHPQTNLEHILQTNISNSFINICFSFLIFRGNEQKAFFVASQNLPWRKVPAYHRTAV